VEAVAEGLELPGRVELLKGAPPLILDAAHNPDGARALAEALPEAAGEAPVVACIAILADKDAAGVLAALAPRLDVAVCTELPAERLARAGRPGARSLEAAQLAELAEAAGMARTEVVGRPEAALRRAMTAARERGGVTLVTGSHYLLGYAAGTRIEHDSEASGERKVN
jgi:dihydrofolate synthase / folylpolyglutamate synthase